MGAELRPVVEISFKAGLPDPETGRRWVTAAVCGGQEMVIGYTRPFGEAVAVHGSGEGWPRIAVCADDTRALGAVIGAWGDQVASQVGADGE